MISSEVGLRKPDPAIYELAAERIGLPPEACVYVDDLPGNLKPARALGMATVLHRGDAEATLAEVERASEIVAQVADYFLQITGIAGESKEAKHKDWIDVTVVVVRRDQRRDCPDRWRRGRRQGPDERLQLHEGHGARRARSCSWPARNGQRMKEAKLSAVKSGAMQQEYLSWTFSDVLISAYQTTGSGGDDLSMDSVSLAFSKVQVEYKAQKADGSLEAPIMAGWDVMANKKS